MKLLKLVPTFIFNHRNTVSSVTSNASKCLQYQWNFGFWQKVACFESTFPHQSRTRKCSGFSLYRSPLPTWLVGVIFLRIRYPQLCCFILKSSWRMKRMEKRRPTRSAAGAAQRIPSGPSLRGSRTVNGTNAITSKEVIGMRLALDILSSYFIMVLYRFGFVWIRKNLKSN